MKIAAIWTRCVDMVSGSCFPNGVWRLINTPSDQADIKLRVLGTVESTNDAQKHVPGRKLKSHFDIALTGKHIAGWGLASKPDTDDMREAHSRIGLRPAQR